MSQLPVWGARQWLRFTPEATFATYQASPPAGTVFWIRLHQNKAFSVRPKPLMWQTMTADAGNRLSQVGSAKTAVGGSLMTLFYPEQAALLLAAACKLVTSASPNAITQYDLQSYTVDHCDGLRLRRYLGTKFGRLALAGDNQSDLMGLSANLTAAQTGAPDAGFLESAQAMPAELPYVFQESAGQVVLGTTAGVARVNYKSLQLTIENVLRAKFNENRYANVIQYCGRKVTGSISSEYLATTDRDNFEAVTALNASVEWYRDANNHAAIALNSHNWIQEVDDEDSLDDLTYQTINFQCGFDPSQAAPTDISGSVVYNGGAAVTF